VIAEKLIIICNNILSLKQCNSMQFKSKNQNYVLIIIKLYYYIVINQITVKSVYNSIKCNSIFDTKVKQLLIINNR